MVAEHPTQPEGVHVLGASPVQNTTTRSKVVAPVLAHKPVQLQQHQQPSTTLSSRGVDTPINIWGCSNLSQAKVIGAEIKEKSPTNIETTTSLKKKFCSDNLDYLHPGTSVVNSEQPTSLSTTPVARPGHSAKRKNFNTVKPTRPSSGQLLNCDCKMKCTSIRNIKCGCDSSTSCEHRRHLGVYQRGTNCVHRDPVSALTSLDPLQCEHLRGGWCVVHEVQARKTIELVKTWKRLKSGLFGKVVRRRTKYKCELKLQTGVKTFQPGPSAIFGAESGRGWVTKSGSNSEISGGGLDSRLESVKI